MTGADIIALAGVGVAGLSAVASSVAPLVQGSLQRRHEERMARADRLYRDMRDAYSELLESLYRIQGVIDRAQADPAIDAGHEMLKLVDDFNYQLRCRKAFAAARSIASDDVDAAIDLVDKASTRFMTIVQQEAPDADKQDLSYQTYLDELGNLERLMRREIRAL